MHATATLSRQPAARGWSAIVVYNVAVGEPSGPPTEIWIGLDAVGKSGSHAHPSTYVPLASVTNPSNEPIGPRRIFGVVVWRVALNSAALTPGGQDVFGLLRHTWFRIARH